MASKRELVKFEFELSKIDAENFLGIFSFINAQCNKQICDDLISQANDSTFISRRKIIESEREYFSHMLDKISNSKSIIVQEVSEVVND